MTEVSYQNSNYENIFEIGDAVKQGWHQFRRAAHLLNHEVKLFLKEEFGEEKTAFIYRLFKSLPFGVATALSPISAQVILVSGFAFYHLFSKKGHLPKPCYSVISDIAAVHFGASAVKNFINIHSSPMGFIFFPINVLLGSIFWEIGTQLPQETAVERT